MAKKPANTAKPDEADRKPSLVMALLIVTLIAGGAGAGFAFTVLANNNKTPAAGAEAPEAAPSQHKAESHASRYPTDAVEVPLEPIITGLGAGTARKMRLEASVIMTKEAATSPTLKTELTEDIVIFLNSVTAEEISGPRGLQHLREDLDDRARIRGRGTVLGLLISGFVVE